MNIKNRLAKLEKAKQKSPYSDMNREEKIKHLTTLMADHEERHPLCPNCPECLSTERHKRCLRLDQLLQGKN